jgi:hypothetical protein
MDLGFLDVDEEPIAVGVPERAFRESKAAGQFLGWRIGDIGDLVGHGYLHQ